MVELDYTVRLERVFQGPMDLLLHLVREQEVEIHEIELQRIVDGYLAYLRQLQHMDLELAGDFLLMAATLVSIKSRSLLPREEVDIAAEIDPRDELIQRLVQYRRFRLAAQLLEARWHERQRVSERGYKGEVKELEDEPQLDLSDVTAYDFLTTYSRLLREISANRPHKVAGDPRPLRYYVRQLVAALRSARASRLSELVEAMPDVPHREAVVGSFCALLELTRLGVLHVEQPEQGGEIELQMKSEFEGDLDELIKNIALDDEPQPDEEAGAQGSAATEG